tara:strand:- start:1751 stop:1918 length:168 start_codon:yes stop_codon:yes gene_type:complete
MKQFLFNALQFIVIALMAFALFAWIELKFFLPQVEKDILDHLPKDSAYYHADTIC